MRDTFSPLLLRIDDVDKITMSLPGILLEEFSVDAGSPAKLFALDPKVGVVQEDPDADVDRRPRHSRKHFRYKKLDRSVAARKTLRCVQTRRKTYFLFRRNTPAK